MTKIRKDITTAELMSMDYTYCYSDQELLADWDKLKTCREYKTGSQFRPGIKLCQHFCDNFWHIQNSTGRSFHDCWNDPEVMDRVRTWGLRGMSNLWMSWIRRAVFMVGGLPNSSFYRPHFAKQIIELTGISHGTLYDPCAGWGGRMLGTVAAGWEYHACEPNEQTHANLMRMAEFLGIQHRVNIQCCGAEHNTLQQQYDVVLTSPPYFNLEVYCDDKSQCYHQYHTYSKWEQQWLVPLIEHSLQHVNVDGISAWNVMDFGKNSLVQAVTQTHNHMGWQLHSTLGFKSPLNNIRKLKRKDVTYVFKKS